MPARHLIVLALILGFFACEPAPRKMQPAPPPDPEESTPPPRVDTPSRPTAEDTCAQLEARMRTLARQSPEGTLDLTFEEAPPPTQPLTDAVRAVRYQGARVLVPALDYKVQIDRSMDNALTLTLIHPPGDTESASVISLAPMTAGAMDFDELASARELKQLPSNHADLKLYDLLVQAYTLTPSSYGCEAQALALALTQAHALILKSKTSPAKQRKVYRSPVLDDSLLTVATLQNGLHEAQLDFRTPERDYSIRAVARTPERFAPLVALFPHIAAQDAPVPKTLQAWPEPQAALIAFFEKPSAETARAALDAKPAPDSRTRKLLEGALEPTKHP